MVSVGVGSAAVPVFPEIPGVLVAPEIPEDGVGVVPRASEEPSLPQPISTTRSKPNIRMVVNFFMTVSFLFYQFLIHFVIIKMKLYQVYNKFYFYTIKR